MKLTHILNEMPQNILQLNVLDDLSIHEVNYSKYKQLFNLNKDILYKYSDTRIVYQSGNCYFCLDMQLRKVLYFMEYTTSFATKLGGTFLWQSLVWRDKSVIQVQQLPHDIFFNHLLQKYGVITTDGEQTADGKRFWMYQISYAFQNQLYVYYYNMNTQELIHIPDALSFERIIHNNAVWGDTKDHQSKLLVIAKKQLM